MGRHSGYELLFNHLANKTTSKNLFCSPSALLDNLLLAVRKAGMHFGDRRNEFYDPSSFRAELSASLLGRLTSVERFHLAYVENQFEYLNSSRKLARFSRKGIDLIGTVHQPVSWWLHHNYFQLLAGFDKVITLTKFDETAINQIMPAKAQFIPHGVDLSFFEPAEAKMETSAMRCLFVGQWLRDFDMLKQVISRIGEIKKDIMFDLVLPAGSGVYTSMIPILRHPQVKLHRNLSDEALRDVYQRADLLFLPLLDCTANNAILEAMASGLPIITSDLPSIKSYVHSDFASLVGNDPEQAVEKIIDHYDKGRVDLTKRGLAARKYAEEHFNWETISESVLNLYQSLSSPKEV